MSIRALDAASAYASSLNRTGPVSGSGAAGATEAVKPAGGGFSEFLASTFDDAVSATAKQEVASAGQVAKSADLVDVVTAVNNAEIALETIVAVRDRMINAYQEIMRMPI